MSTIFIILVFIMLLLLVLTPTVYWSFLDSRIKDKKAMLSFLEPAHKGAFHMAIYCALINLILFLVIEFATTNEYSAILMQIQFIAYLAVLIIPKSLISCLKTSIEKEESASKSTTCDSEDTK
ncbi:MAG: hypothetical protein FWE63_00410 [Bacteroidales bacterium]|nr:hypothetical protein [Bacteroidales bacterium]